MKIIIVIFRWKLIAILYDRKKAKKAINYWSFYFLKDLCIMCYNDYVAIIKTANTISQIILS